MKNNTKKIILTTTLSVSMLLGSAMAMADDNCDALGLGNKNAIHATLLGALQAVSTDAPVNGGLGNHMWGVIVDQDGKVCAVAFSGPSRISQWPGSRVIAAQKANTATSFNLPAGLGGTVDALSTANLWAATQPGGSLWGLQHSNPVDTGVAYGSSSHSGGGANKYGQKNDPMKGEFIGGVNVFGGGLALYDAAGNKVGALGASGDTSCADHNVAWRTRDRIGLDFVPSGLSAPGADDNIIYDVLIDATTGHGVSASGFGHPDCGFGEMALNPAIVTACPTGDGASVGCL